MDSEQNGQQGLRTPRRSLREDQHGLVHTACGDKFVCGLSEDPAIVFVNADWLWPVCFKREVPFSWGSWLYWTRLRHVLTLDVGQAGGHKAVLENFPPQCTWV